MLNIELLKNKSDFEKVNLTQESYVDFMHTHLDKFGDPKPAISKCIDYAFSTDEAKGGFVLAAFEEDKLIGGLIMNKTAMKDYIPSYILVYVAVDSSQRGKGFGRKIIEKSFELVDDNVKLHVEYDNPAKRLYERIGFTTKYAEMRYDINLKK